MIICVARESAFQRQRQMSKSLFPGSERLLSDAARNTKYAFVGQAGEHIALLIFLQLNVFDIWSGLDWLIPSEFRPLSVASGKVLKSFSTWGQVVYETLTNTFLTDCICFHGQSIWMWCLKYFQIYVLPSGRSACGELLLYAGYLIGLSLVQILVPTLHWRQYFPDFSVNFGQALVFLTSMVLGTFIQNNHSPSLYLHHQSWYMANTTNVTSIGSWLLRQTLCSRASFECWLQISI